MVARKVRIAALIVAVMVTVIVAALGGTYAALKNERPFYRQALAIDPETLEQGSRELESQIAALYNDARRPGRWHAAFTAGQINGWLATKLDELDDGDIDGVVAPRIAIGDNTFTLGFRARRGVDTVISTDAALSMTETGAVAIRLIDVRAGAMPLPVMQVADVLSKAFQDLELPVRWTQVGGQPVALVDVDKDISSDGRVIVLDTVELRDKTLYLAGHTEEIGGNSNGNVADD